MYARVSTYEGASLQDYDAAQEKLETEVLPRVRALSGYRGMVSMVDRSTGKSVSITFWEDEQAVAGTREAANRLRSQVADSSGSTIADVAEYEIDHAEFPGQVAGAAGPNGS